MISIIVPVYNAEKTLNRCIDSILSQTYQDWELLLINDGSRDDSLAISKEYALSDKRIKVLDKLNGGVSSARNMGLDNAKGDWITFVDSDDYIGEHYFDEIPNRKEDLVIYNLKCLGDDYSGVPHAKESICSSKVELVSYLSSNLRKEEFLSSCGKFFRRDILKSQHFLLHQALGEDTIFVQEYLNKCSSLVLLAFSLYYYSDSDISFCKKYKMHIDDAKEQLMNIYNAYLQLGIECQEFVSFELELFRKVCANEILNDSKLWYCDNRIQDVYNSCRNFLGIKGRIKYTIFKMPIVYKWFAKYLK